MRKNKKNLNNKEIEEVFLKKVSLSGIVAVYIYNKTERNIVNVMNQQQKFKVFGSQDSNNIEQDEDVANENYKKLSIHERNVQSEGRNHPKMDDITEDEFDNENNEVETFFEYFDKENFCKFQ